ncbi:hypothetical protein NXW86_29840 [Bacteroides thetaiotaomicron]|uniref:hypothetical protein n=1 Tax=Bacteroides thetaiotaomicron TaxID=818 RepID=UPI0021656838|nr:hypothetical protein [Bacteroides thetaiotaomicron]MCS2453167.1 hypothetical protein [Bacteroides thetaiotaomicron]
MKKILLNISLALALGFSISSCNDWLTVWSKPRPLVMKLFGKMKHTWINTSMHFYTYLNKYGQFGEAQFSGGLTESLTETFKYGS